MNVYYCFLINIFIMLICVLLFRLFFYKYNPLYANDAKANKETANSNMLKCCIHVPGMF